jgi:uncharacterized protein (DUF1697 family)
MARNDGGPLKFVALLRGINVGKGPRVSMKDLTAVLERAGARNVVTYLNSGNAVFEAEGNAATWSTSIERAIERALGEIVPVVVRTGGEVCAIAEAIPKSWKGDESQQTYVVYLSDDIASPQIVEELPVKHQYVTFRYAHRAIIWNIKKENFNRSQITKISAHPAYGRMTIRNVNTARKLADLCREQ